ncbi:MAG TPA: hypothetical protein VFY05_05615, partial [Candidatus Angelobacter sp.]|nr:hypothetical protein [Candidatus Angelobacter sp.]
MSDQEQEISSSGKKPVRKMSKDDVAQAITKCQELLTEALQRARSRPQVSNSLVSLGQQVIAAIETANKGFQKETIVYLTTLLQAHIDALFRIDEGSPEAHPARKQLEMISESLSKRLTSPQVSPYNPLELK